MTPFEALDLTERLPFVPRGPATASRRHLRALPSSPGASMADRS